MISNVMSWVKLSGCRVPSDAVDQWCFDLLVLSLIQHSRSPDREINKPKAGNETDKLSDLLRFPLIFKIIIEYSTVIFVFYTIPLQMIQCNDVLLLQFE